MKLVNDRRRPRTPPLPEVEETRQEVRRSSRRIRAPAAFYHVDENGNPRALSLTLFSGKGTEQLAKCMLYDVNDQGLAFASPDILDMNLTGILSAHHPGEREPVASARISVVNERSWKNPPQDELPDFLRGTPELFVYGARIEEEDVRSFVRLVLESLAVSMSRMATH